ncbi:MAG: hypothetical protein OCC49_18410 [Fibrobacterales bacterium]
MIRYVLLCVLVTLMACDVNGPWEYEPKNEEASSRIVVHAVLYQGRSIKDICFDKVYSVNELSIGGRSFYDSARVTLFGLFNDDYSTSWTGQVFHSSKYPLLLDPRSDNENCFTAHDSIVPIAGERYELHADFYWDSSGVESHAEISAAVSIPRYVELDWHESVSSGSYRAIEELYSNYHYNYIDSTDRSFVDYFNFNIRYLSPEVKSYCIVLQETKDYYYLSNRRQYGNYEDRVMDGSIVFHTTSSDPVEIHNEFNCPVSIDDDPNYTSQMHQLNYFSPGENIVVLMGFSDGYKRYHQNLKARGTYNYGGDVWTNITGGTGVFVGVALDSAILFLKPDSSGIFPYIKHSEYMWNACFSDFNKDKVFESQCAAEYHTMCDDLNYSVKGCQRSIIFRNLKEGNREESVTQYTSDWELQDTVLTGLIETYYGLDSADYSSAGILAFGDSVYLRAGQDYLYLLRARHLRELRRQMKGFVPSEGALDSAWIEYCLYTDFENDTLCNNYWEKVPQRYGLSTFVLETCTAVEWYPGCGRGLLHSYEKLLQEVYVAPALEREMKEYCSNHVLEECSHKGYPQPIPMNNDSLDGESSNQEIRLNYSQRTIELLN